MLRLPSQPIPTEWNSNWKDIQPALRKVRRSMASLRTSSLKVMRVSQLDSDILDMELVDILKEQLWAALSLFKPTIKENFEPELLGLLNLTLFKLSIYDSSATYGSQLQNLKYRNEWKHGGAFESIAKDAPLTQGQKIAYGLFTVGGQYAWTRANRYITMRGWGEMDDSSTKYKIYQLLQTGEKYWKAFSLLNFLIFLWNGRYRTLIDRILAMRLVYSKKSMNRQVSFEFLNRQMVWHAFTEFLLFLVPLINVEKLKMKMMRMLLPKSYLVSSKGYDKLPNNQCAICHDSASNHSGPIGQIQKLSVHNAYETNCGHQYCYYCIQSKLSVFGDEWPCLRCGEKVTTIHKHIEKIEDKPVLEESYVELEKEE
ncbi:Pex12 amino terminal region-domain-containing protein [Mucor mucedo]|uniref:Pex12 amino terminal region-domain-containing protein n=1 Tax=Mucor mucedo TaxID=29922 RepID=UPI0022209F57|nr:Pex12 amino terminal region-domain-containing protein [Mucor mucedo]KAI7885942.1 Pex12 amino terminal region-domain-containing protein [Mucor mucedo]